MNEDLESTKYQQGSELEAVTLMSNHAHEKHRVTNPCLFSNHMRRHHARYGMYFNRKRGRCGKVAQQRPHTTLLENEKYEMEATFYIHANPLRAKMIRDMRNYYWSTHVLYAFGKRHPWMRNVKLPSWYLKLGNTPKERQRNYRWFFAHYLRRNGLTKKTVFKRYFYGSSNWCEEQERNLKSIKEAPP